MGLPTLLIAGKVTPENKKDNYKDIIPIDHILKWFQDRVNKTGINNRVLILKSDTGSGKSTVFPVHLFQWYIKSNPKVRIAVSQPRVLTTISIVREELIGSGYYPFLKLGENIGWKTGFSRKATDFGLTYMTVDSLSMQLRSLSDEQIINKYNVIILDEVHELSLGLTYLLYLLKKFMERNAKNSKLPFVVATSATFDVYKYMKYFEVDATSVIRVEGSTYPKLEHFSQTFSANYIADIAKLAIQIHKDNLKDKPTEADILAFVPGATEAETILKQLQDANAELLKGKQPVFLPLFIDRDAVIYGKREHELVFAPPDILSVSINGKKYKPMRRIILSTNIAETGLTISTLKYVIESGISREVEYYPTNNVSALVSKPVSMSRFRQRIGRVGRKFPGEFYTLYPKDILTLLKENQYPDIITSDMSIIILPILVELVKSAYTKKEFKYYTDTEDLNERYDEAAEPTIDVTKVNLIDGIPPDTLHNNVEKLCALGFLSYEKQFKLTKLGHIGALFNLEPESTRMLLAAYSWDCCAADLATVAVFIDFTIKKYDSIAWHVIYKDAMPKHFTLSGDSNLIALKLRTTIADTFLDGLFLIRAVQNYLRSADLIDPIEAIKTYCARVNISNYHIIIELIKSRDTLIEHLFELGFNPFNQPSIFDQHEDNFNDTIIKLKYCIYDGYRLNILTYRSETDDYISQLGMITKGPKLTLDVIKQFTFTQKPKRILYNNLMLKQKKDKFIAAVDKFCTLDGYVNPDDYFMSI